MDLLPGVCLRVYLQDATLQGSSGCMMQGCLTVALCRPVRATGSSAKEDASRGREAFSIVALQLSCQLTRQLPYCPPNMCDPARLEMDLETRHLR